MTLFVILMGMFLAGAVAGAMGLFAIASVRNQGKRELQAVIGQGGMDAPTVEEVNEAQLADMSIEELQALIFATELFVGVLKERVALRYEPTETEQAMADITHEQNVAFEEALASTYSEG